MTEKFMLIGVLCFVLGMVAELILQKAHGVIDLDVRIENAVLSETNKKLGEENELLKMKVMAITNDWCKKND